LELARNRARRAAISCSPSVRPWDSTSCLRPSSAVRRMVRLTPSALPASVEIMVAMATFGADVGSVVHQPPRGLARDREGGWLTVFSAPRRCNRSGFSPRGLRLGCLVALPAIVAVGITGVLAHGVPTQRWASGPAGLVLLWVGTLPFIALGIAIGSLTSSTVAYALSTGFLLRLRRTRWVVGCLPGYSRRHYATWP